jgi:hypothetical protein
MDKYIVSTDSGKSKLLGFIGDEIESLRQYRLR